MVDRKIIRSVFGGRTEDIPTGLDPSRSGSLSLSKHELSKCEAI